MVFSLLYLGLCRILDLVTTRCFGRDKDVEILVLRHQVKILERQLHRRLRYEPADRALLAALSRLLPRDRWQPFLVTPETLLRWHREVAKRKWRRWRQQRRPGRPALDPDVVALIVRLGQENRSWGCVRIQGELRKLGIRVSATSVRRVLRCHRLGPAPRSGPSWAEFLRAQAEGILATDFLSVATVFFQRLYEVFVSEGIEIIQTPVRAPRANAYSERWVRTVRRECLAHLLLVGRRHAESVLRTYVGHYNEQRPHRGIGLAVPVTSDPADVTIAPGHIERRDVLGGIIHEYYRAAA